MKPWKVLLLSVFLVGTLGFAGWASLKPQTGGDHGVWRTSTLRLDREYRDRSDRDLSGSARAAQSRTLGKGSEVAEVSLSLARQTVPDGSTTYRWGMWDCGVANVDADSVASITVAGPDYGPGWNQVVQYSPSDPTFWEVRNWRSWDSLATLRTQAGGNTPTWTFTIRYKDGTSRAVSASVDLTGLDETTLRAAANQISIKRNGVELCRGVTSNVKNTAHVLDPFEDRNWVTYDWSGLTSPDSYDVVRIRNTLSTTIDSEIYGEQETLKATWRQADLAGKSSFSTDFNKLYLEGDTKKPEDWRKMFVTSGNAYFTLQVRGRQVYVHSRAVMLPDVIADPRFGSFFDLLDSGDGNTFASPVLDSSIGSITAYPLLTGNGDYEVISMQGKMAGVDMQSQLDSGHKPEFLAMRSLPYSYSFWKDAKGLTGVKPFQVVVAYRNGKTRTMEYALDVTPPKPEERLLSLVQYSVKPDSPFQEIKPVQLADYQKFRFSWSNPPVARKLHGAWVIVHQINGGYYNGSGFSVRNPEENSFTTPEWNDLSMPGSRGIVATDIQRFAAGMRFLYAKNYFVEMNYRIRSRIQNVAMRVWPQTDAVYANVGGTANNGFGVNLNVEAGQGEKYDGMEFHVAFNPLSFDLKPANVKVVAGANWKVLQNRVVQESATQGYLDLALGLVDPSKEPGAGNLTVAQLFMEAKPGAISASVPQGTPVVFELVQNPSNNRISDMTYRGKSVVSERTSSTFMLYPASAWGLGKVALTGNRPPLGIPLRVHLRGTWSGGPVSRDLWATVQDAAGTFTFPVPWNLDPTSTMEVGAHRVFFSQDGALKKSLITTRSGMVQEFIAPSPATNLVNFGTLVEGDINEDNAVNILDFSLLVASYNKKSGQAGYDCRADINDDGIVNLTDYSILSANFGGYQTSSVADATEPEGSKGSGGCDAWGFLPGFLLAGIPLVTRRSLR